MSVPLTPHRQPREQPEPRHGTGSGAGPPLALLAGLFAALFVASVVGVTIATSGAHFPSPFDPLGKLSEYLGAHHSALQVSAFLQFASAIPLAILTASNGRPRSTPGHSLMLGTTRSACRVRASACSKCPPHASCRVLLSARSRQ